MAEEVATDPLTVQALDKSLTPAKDVTRTTPRKRPAPQKVPSTPDEVWRAKRLKTKTLTKAQHKVNLLRVLYSR